MSPIETSIPSTEGLATPLSKVISSQSPRMSSVTSTESPSERLTPDTSKGQVLGITPLICDPTDATSCYFLEGLAITLDLGYQVALAEDSSQATGFSVTNESMGGSVLFVNVDPGTVNATLTPPSGYSCDYMPPEVEVVASHYHEVTVFCSED